jgi:hypothetical protein
METAPSFRPPSFNSFVDEVSPCGDTTEDRSAFVGQYTAALIQYRRSIGIDHKGIGEGIEVDVVPFDEEQLTANNN